MTEVELLVAQLLESEASFLCARDSRWFKNFLSPKIGLSVLLSMSS